MMSNAPRVLGFAIAGLIATAAAAAAQETIDFEGFDEGEIVNTVTSTPGGLGPIGVEGFNGDFPADANAAVIFDTACPPGGVPADCSGEDPDLGTPNEDFGGPGVGAGGAAGEPFENDTAQGKILIVAEDLVDTSPAPDGLVDDPDDTNGLDSSTTFDFSALGTVTLVSVTVIDVEAEETPATIELFDAADVLIDTIALPATGDNGVAIVSLGDTPGVKTMVVMMRGSGGIDDVVFLPEQVSTTVPTSSTTTSTTSTTTSTTSTTTSTTSTTTSTTSTTTTTLPPTTTTSTTSTTSTLPPTTTTSTTTSTSTTTTTLVGGEGCTPGYWKTHTDRWVGFAPGDSFDATFGVDAFGPALTLLEAAAQGGGGLAALGRHAVAALLNASHAEVSYSLTVDAVILLVQDAVSSGDFESTKDLLADFNEDGCPLGGTPASPATSSPATRGQRP